MCDRRKNVKRICYGLSSAMMIFQTAAYSMPVQAEKLEFEGTTQIETNSCYLDADIFMVDLEVAEVCVQSGSQVAQGDQILKWTEDSYEEAVDYYAAAIIRADNNLTDVQLEYDQGILESRYTFENAQVKAEQAEAVKEYQQKELEDTIAGHEEVLEDIDARIAELTDGISNGSWGTGSGSGSVGAERANSSGNGGSNGAPSGDGKTEEETSEEQSEMSEETEIPGGGTGIPQEQPGMQEGETATGDSDIEMGAPETEGGDSKQTIETLKSSIEEKNTEYDQILEQIEALGFDLSGTGNETDSEGKDTESAASVTSEEQLQESIDGDTNVKTNLENIQDNLNSVPDAVMEVVTAAYPDYENYIELLDNCIKQLNADIEIQEKIKTILGEGENEHISEADETAMQQLLSGLLEIGTQRSELYSQLIQLQEEWINTLQTEQQPETEQESETEQNSGTDKERLDGNSPMDGSGNQKQSSGNNQTGGSFSMASGSGATSGLSGMTGGDSAQTDSSGGAQLAGDMSLSESEISLFGDTYDLTQIKNLIEREPSDSDNAQELIEQLEDGRETVENQYEELIREQKITELGIQYTYDTAVISGKLAEFTYQQEMQEWEEQLGQAKSEKKDLELVKELLDSMSDGILTADRDGIVAEMLLEEGDTISGMEPVISYYDMDTVTIVIEVSQEEIALLDVGDTVNVTINGFLSREGWISEKATEPESGTSRTTVNYEVKIAVDNADGALNSGSSAVVTVSSGNEEAKK